MNAKNSVGAVVLGLLLLVSVFLQSASAMPNLRYTFVCGGYPGVVIHVNSTLVDCALNQPVVINPGDVIYATWPDGCVPPGQGCIGYIFVNADDANHTPVMHLGPGGTQINYYSLWISPRCESGSWTLNGGGANPPQTQNPQYCPCGGAH